MPMKILNQQNAKVFSPKNIIKQSHLNRIVSSLIIISYNKVFFFLGAANTHTDLFHLLETVVQANFIILFPINTTMIKYDYIRSLQSMTHNITPKPLPLPLWFTMKFCFF